MKKVKYLLIVLLAVLCTVSAGQAQSSGSMRCRDGIVSIGDTMPEVIKKCGSPEFQDRRKQSRIATGRQGRSFEIITIDDWIYNFGPQEFMYQLIFEGGRVARIESLDYGY